MKQKSGRIRKEWLQVNALCCGMDWDERDLSKPQILVEDVFGDSHPGSVHLDSLGKEASIGIFQEGGKPARFHGTDICDGWAMLRSAVRRMPSFTLRRVLMSWGSRLSLNVLAA